MNSKLKELLRKIIEKLITGAKDTTKPLWQRILKWIIGIILAGVVATYCTSCTGIDSLILTGEKGQVHYYTTPEGNKAIVFTPSGSVKILPSKK